MKSKTAKMGFWSIVLLTVNSIIGTGIFLSPGSVVKSSGALAPVVYLCAAIFAAVLAITFASASKYVTKGGAAYAYSKAAFGKNVGLYVGITRFVAASIAWGVMATAVVNTTLSIFGNSAPTFMQTTIGFIILMAVLLIINLLGTRVLTVISNLSTIGKITALALTVVAGVVILITTGQNNFDQLYTMVDDAGKSLFPTMTSGVFVMAVISAFYAFTGFEAIASGSQDMEEPEKNLPRAIPLAIGIIAVIYIAIVLVSMAINPVALATSNEVVVLAAVFENKILRTVIVVGALVSMFGINVASSFHTPRVLEAMAKEDQIPQFFAKRMDSGLPLFAFILTAVLAIFVPMAFQYNMGSIMIISSISRFVQFLVVPTGVICFYYGKSKEPILDAHKNVFTDVVLPVISLILTVVLLAKFNWVGQFSIVDAQTGASSANVMAISAMVIGYVVIPAIMFAYNASKKK